MREPEQRPTFHQEGRERGPALVLALGTTLSPVELDEYQPLFDNAKKLRALLAELQERGDSAVSLP